ncbi:MAG: AmmeMemoRadiSam system protein B [Chloroflexi bacterium]|nr:AmmeMemoRadiSam system protein B [Chloroflexota bacterium]
MINDTPAPALRPLDIKRVAQDGAEYFLLRDPLELTEQQLLVPVMLGPLLLLLDGTRTPDRVRTELMLRYGLPFHRDDLAELLETLSGACLLDDRVSATAVQRQRDAYRGAPFRPAALTDRVYPSDPDDLTSMLRRFEQHSAAQEDADLTDLVGLISPHIDYARGGPVYAKLWRAAAPALREADVVVIFGTDHSGSPGALTLTRQSYATPWGVLPSDMEAVDAMAEALGHDGCYAEELHHRSEHAVELAAVWLHHVRDGKPCTVIPVLCGHPMPWMNGAGVGGRGPGVGEGDGAAADSSWECAMRALEALRDVTAGRRVVAVAAADLAHVGPAFGDAEPASALAKRKVRLADEELLAACRIGPAEMLACAGRIDDRYRICGLSPIALTLAFTGPVAAETTGYDQCPADHDGGSGSIVSIAGVLLRRTAG